MTQVITRACQSQDEQGFPETEYDQQQGQDQADQGASLGRILAFQGCTQVLPDILHLYRSTRAATGSTRVTLIRT